MRSESQIKRMIIQLKQMEERMDPEERKEELREIRGKIDILEWVLDAPDGKYHG